MPKLFSCLIAIIFFCATTFAQTTLVKGYIKDVDKKGISNAVVALLTQKDSLLYKFTRTNTEGKFTLNDIKPDKYILMTTHPYYADVLDDITVNTGDNSLDTYTLTSKSKLLQEIIVKSGSPIKIKGDTTIYTADSFKVSANANVEELLKKLPGIQVDKSGKITAMGEQVNKVLVDGEEFFGDDPGMAVKNLRADAVKEVQVFDKKSDQAEFTGIDDGKTQKTINLKLKEDKKHGYFGKIDGAGGLMKNIEDRYNTNLMFGSFKGKRKISTYFLRGNTGQDGMNWQDAEKFGGENENYSLDVTEDGEVAFNTRGSVDDEPKVNTENGFIVNTNAGLQYSNKWNEKSTLNFSPKYNSQLYTNHKYNFLQTIVGDSILNDNANTTTNVNRSNIKTSATYDIKIDSLNAIKITAKANFYSTESEEIRNANTTGQYGTLKNESSRKLNINNDKQALLGSVLYKHKFKKIRRTLSINTEWNTLKTNANNFLQSDSRAYYNGLPSSLVAQDQKIIGDKTTQNLSSKIIYTEPLSKRFSLEVAHEILYNTGNNNQTTYSYAISTGKYDDKVDSLSNEFKQQIIVNIPSVKLSYNYKKLKYFFGSGFAITNFNLTDITYSKNYDRNFVNISPSAGITYAYKSNNSIRFDYNGSTAQPTINQLQPLRNNNDYFNQFIGNPTLKPSFTNTFNLTHNNYNFLKARWMYQSLNVRVTNNAIANNKIINVDSGKTIIQPINTNGNIGLTFWSGFGFKITKTDWRLNISPSFNYNRYADFLNSQEIFSNNINAGVSVSISKYVDKKYELSLGNDFYYNRNKTSLADLASTYNTNSLMFDATVYIKKTWSLSSNYAFHYRQKVAAFSGSLNNQLWNARLQRTFKNDEFTAYFSVKDILNENKGVDMSYYSNTFSQERNDRLKRYCMLGFIWNFKNKAAAKQ